MKGKSDPFDNYTLPIHNSFTESKSDDECSNTNFSSKLVKLTAAFDRVKLQESLHIELQGTSVLIAKNSRNEPCGNLVSVYNGKIISCIGKGKKFKAIVVDLDGMITVRCV